jgi:hypothetical protein
MDITIFNPDLDRDGSIARDLASAIVGIGEVEDRRDFSYSSEPY